MDFVGMQNYSTFGWLEVCWSWSSYRSVRPPLHQERQRFQQYLPTHWTAGPPVRLLLHLLTLVIISIVVVSWHNCYCVILTHVVCVRFPKKGGHTFPARGGGKWRRNDSSAMAMKPTCTFWWQLITLLATRSTYVAIVRVSLSFGIWTTTTCIIEQHTGKLHASNKYNNEATYT